MTFQSLSWKEQMRKSPAPTDTDAPGCRVFGRNLSIPACTSDSRMAVAKKIDDKIEVMAERIFSNRSCSDARKCGDNASFVIKDERAYHTEGVTPTSKEEPQTILEEIRAVFRPVPSLKEFQNIAQELAVTSGGFFFPENGNIENHEFLEEDEDVDEDIDEDIDVDYVNTSVESATLDFNKGTQDCASRESWKKKRGDCDDNETYSTGGSYDESEGSVSLNHQEAVQFNFAGKRRVMSENNKFDIENDLKIHNSNVRYKSRTLDSYPGPAVQEDVGCEGDDEESTLEDPTPMIDEVFDDDNEPRQSSDSRNKNTKGEDKPSLPSVVENIAEVLSLGGKACGYFSSEDGAHGMVNPMSMWKRRSSTEPVEVPKTVDPNDLQSVGELTAITLEKNEIQERSRMIIMKRLGLPKEIMAWSAAARSGAKGLNDGKEATPNQQHSNDTTVNQQERSENYFAEYEEGVAGVRSIYNSGGDNASKSGNEGRLPVNPQTKNLQEESPFPIKDKTTRPHTTNHDKSKPSLQRIQGEAEIEYS